MKRAVIALVILAGLAAAAVYVVRLKGGIVGDATHSTERPNVLLVTLDTFRADRLGRGLTPNLDALAARGTRYTNVRATAPLTLPSHTSIMTGVIPPVHGVRENGVVFDRKTPTLAKSFRDHGYATAAFVGAFVLNRRFGLDEGFETYDDTVRRNSARPEQLEAERPGGAVVDAALAWLQQPRDRPFFLWVHLYDAHAPYAPPEDFRDRDDGDPYDREIAYVDAQVGRLLRGVTDGGLGGTTVVAAAADHGEALGEHGEATHGMLAYDGTLRVPLVIAGVAARGARTDDRALSLTALARLLLTAAGLPAIGDSGDHLYAESWYPRRAGWHSLGVLVDRQWKMILSGERELYDIRTDPGEGVNVAATHPSVADAMAVALAKLQLPQRGPAPVAPDAAERLRALGYVSGSAPMTQDGSAENPARVIGAWIEFERALDSLRGGSAAAALPALKALAEQHTGAPLFLSTYAAALKESGRPAEAVTVYRRAVQTWPGDATLFHDLAVAAREAGDSTEAARAEQAALALDADSPMALNGVGLLHVDAGRMHDAEQAFLRATQLDPTNASYWTNLGNVRFNLSAPGAAIEAYRKALGVDPAFPDALNGIGTVLVQTGRAGDAVPFLQRALAGAPDLHEARLNLGIAYQELGEKDKAADTYREILKRTPAKFARERNAAAQLLRGLR